MQIKTFKIFFMLHYYFTKTTIFLYSHYHQNMYKNIYFVAYTVTKYKLNINRTFVFMEMLMISTTVFTV